MAVIQQILAGSAGGTSYESEATALFARFSSDPGTTRKDAINTCIASLKTAGVWSKLDCLYVFAAHAEADAKLNWITNDDNLTENGTMDFTTDSGFVASSGSTSNRLEGTRSINALTNFQQNSAHVSLWCTNISGASAAVGMGAASSPISIFPMFSDDNIYLRVNDDPESGGFAIVTPTGHSLGNRSSSTARQGYRNGSSVGSYGSVNSIAPGSDVMRYGPGNTAVTLNAATMGGSLTSGEVTDLYNALNTLKTAIGW